MSIARTPIPFRPVATPPRVSGAPPFVQRAAIKALIGTPKAPRDQGGLDFPPGAEQCAGYSEVYGLYRGTLGWNQLFNTKTFAVGRLANIEFACGADLNLAIIASVFLGRIGRTLHFGFPDA